MGNRNGKLRKLGSYLWDRCVDVRGLTGSLMAHDRVTTVKLPKKQEGKSAGSGVCQKAKSQKASTATTTICDLVRLLLWYNYCLALARFLRLVFVKGMVDANAGMRQSTN